MTKIFRDLSTPEGRAFWTQRAVPSYDEEVDETVAPPGWRSWTDSLLENSINGVTMYSSQHTESSLDRAHQHARAQAQPYVREFAALVLECKSLKEIQALAKKVISRG